ncbi:MAG: hypothetical protein GC178_18115 [Flavobacteriales bacterium]|nr:hypothetical protein [Flavobacteriales bacterium]
MGCRKLSYYQADQLPELKAVRQKNELTLKYSFEKARRSYVFGFQGQEKDDEVAGNGNSYTAEFWQYDTRLGRRWNLDPKGHPSFSFYSAFSLNPIMYSDPLGDTTKFANKSGQVLVDVEDGSDDVYVVADQQKFLKDYEKVAKSGDYKDADANKQIGEKHGVLIKDYAKLLGSYREGRLTDQEFEIGYECGYNPSFLGCLGAVAPGGDPDSDGAARSIGITAGRDDKRAGLMHMYRPKLKNDPPRYRIIEVPSTKRVINEDGSVTEEKNDFILFTPN